MLNYVKKRKEIKKLRVALENVDTLSKSYDYMIKNHIYGETFTEKDLKKLRKEAILTKCDLLKAYAMLVY